MLTVYCEEVRQRSHGVEGPLASEHHAAGGSDDVREQLSDGVRLDGKQKHQPLREGTPGHKPGEVGMLLHSRFPSLRFQGIDNRI